MTKRTSKRPTRRSKKVAVPLARVAGIQVEPDVALLVGELGAMIDAARKQLSVAANATLSTLYWQIGRRVYTEILEGRRAEYAARIVSTLSRQLEVRYGRGFNEKSVRRMVQFATIFPMRR